MPESREAAAIRSALDRARRRVAIIGGTYGVAAGLILGAIVAATGRWLMPQAAWLSMFLVLLPAIAAAIGAVIGRRTDIARAIERATPESRNVIVTADELLRGVTTAPAYLLPRVFLDASSEVSRASLERAFPARRAIAAVAVAAVVMAASVGLTGRGRAGIGPSSPAAAVITGIDVTIVPPPYAHQPSRTFRDPARIEALKGSAIDIHVGADASAVTLNTLDQSIALVRVDDRTFSGTIRADADGFISILPAAANGDSGSRRLIGLTVQPDRAPRVRITTPGHDLIVPDGRRTIAIGIEADDDLALASLTVRYTRVKGSGENFTFTEGHLPLTLSRQSERAWSGRADWALNGLDLEPGDIVIYRGVATDAQPQAPVSESDAFMIEIAAPGALPGEGFAIDDRLDKYAISQQMVIVKTEKLIASRSKLPADDFAREVQGVAAEQRQVRAEFMFMMGGELADAGLDVTTLSEEVEAASEEDLAAGRLANQGRADLLRAIRSMSRAASQLADLAVTDALPHEKEALTYLQRAFSRNRYILRMLAERERLDDSRRLTGTLAGLGRLSQAAPSPAPLPRTVALRRAISDLAALASPDRSAADVANALTALAERVLAIDPGSEPVRHVTGSMAEAGRRPGALSNAGRSAVLFPIALELSAIVQAELPADSSRVSQPALDALAGALAASLRKETRR
jgi:hypothetical protein